MSIASWFTKSLIPRKELLDTAKQLVEMIDNNKEAAKLLNKIDGFQKELDLEYEFSHLYRNLIHQLIGEYNMRDFRLSELELSENHNRDGLVSISIRSNNLHIRYDVRTLGEEITEKQKLALLEDAYKRIYISLALEGLDSIRERNEERAKNMNGYEIIDRM